MRERRAGAEKIDGRREGERAGQRGEGRKWTKKEGAGAVVLGVLTPLNPQAGGIAVR